MDIRNSAKALVISDGKILLNKCCSRLGEYYALPGGGQNPDETLEETVVREVLEEAGLTVIPKRLAGLFELLTCNRTDGQNHKMYFIFECKLDNVPVRIPTEHDLYQIDSEWIPLEEIANINLFPVAIRNEIPRLLSENNTVFIGSERRSK